MNFKAKIINSTLSLKIKTQIPRKFNAHPARRILGYQCMNPNCNILVANAFAYDQDSNHHVTTQGILCARITMRNEVSELRRSDTSTATLSARPAIYVLSLASSTLSWSLTVPIKEQQR
jgi:hypothetical protein